MIINDKEYITGQDRNDDSLVAHLYKGTFSEPGNPMCLRGWNRSDEDSYSIFRNISNVKICSICLRRASQNKDSISSKKRKTKWI